MNWRNSLTENADILLYGCNVAGDLAGAKFVDDFSNYTKADILASTDLTGIENLGGNWNLEYASGIVEADLAFDTRIEQNYEYVLDSPTVNNPPIFDNGTYFKNFPADVTLPGSNSPGATGTIQLNKFFDTPDINTDPPDFLDPGMIDMINNSDFRIEYFPLDTSLFNSPGNPEISGVNFGEAENQPFSIYFTNGNSSILKNNPNPSFNSPKTNLAIYPIDASSLNFNPTNFEFTSVSLNRIEPIDPDRNSITFQFDKGSFDFSSLTDRNVLAFEFDPAIYDAYDINPDNTVRFGNNLTFEATGVSFRSDSITFDYKAETFNFNSTLFARNAHLYEYKLSSANFNAGVTIEQFNASDYRALNYVFKNDELFDSKYYLDTYEVADGTNPFTSYSEDGYKSGRNPNGLFNVNYYLLNNADVRSRGTDPLKHYAVKGYTQDNLNRDPNALFDTSYYKAQNSDVVDEDVNPLLHYIQSGYNENFDSRDPNPLFDTSYYNAKNPDVVAAGDNPLQHYLEFGWKESRRDNPGGFNPNRDPSQFFDTSHYFDTHSDVRIASYKLSSANALQHYLEFGNSGRFANENRVTHPLFETEYLTAFSTFIDSNSESFKSVQNEINNTDNGIQIFPRDDGTVEVAGAIVAVPFVVKGLYYLAVGAAAYFAADRFTRVTFDEDIEYSNFGFVRGDIEGVPYGTEPFPEPQEGQITITTFPKNVNAEDIINPANKDIFFTPLEPIEEISTPNVFPQRDEILDTLLDEPLVFPGTNEIPAGSYAYPSRVDPDWSESYENGENSQIIISSPTQPDFIREANIRQDLINDNQISKAKTRNISFADYQFTNRFGNSRSGTIKAFSGPQDADGYALFVPLQDRILRSVKLGRFNKEVDTEAKIIEQIFRETTALDSGTIRIFTTRPVCDSCGIIIEEFTRFRPNIKIEVIEGNRK